MRSQRVSCFMIKFSSRILCDEPSLWFNEIQLTTALGCRKLTVAVCCSGGAKLVSPKQACLFIVKLHSVAVGTAVVPLHSKVGHSRSRAVLTSLMIKRRLKRLHAAKLRKLPSGTVLYRIGKR